KSKTLSTLNKKGELERNTITNEYRTCEL
ncbi:MAG: hypothetical protein RIR47_520, partial [Bacteroidota bacterium]